MVKIVMDITFENLNRKDTISDSQFQADTVQLGTGLSDWGRYSTEFPVCKLNTYS